MSVGKRIKERRNELHMSVDELAKHLNKNRATIYRYEKEEIENLPIDILEPLSKALNTTPQYLMGWDTKEMYGIRIKDGDNETIYTCVNKNHLRVVESWYNEFGFETFTDEESNKIIEYAKFLLSLREK